jgi:SAM-dependent methyltransferase
MDLSVPLCCPDDLGILDPVSGGVACRQCRRHFPSVDGILELLPATMLQTSAESAQMNAYRASFSSRRDSKWRRPLQVLVNTLGNGYLYSWAARTFENFAGGQSLTVLDAGCGDGVLRRYLSHRHAYVGIDFSSRPLLRATRYNPATYLRADILHIPFPADSFDALFSFQALQYLRNPETALAQFARVLKPGGKLILTVPNNESFKYRIQGIPDIQLQTFDRHLVPRLLARNFTDVAAQTRGIWIPVPKLPIHAPGLYPVRWGLSWTVVATPHK